MAEKENEHTFSQDTWLKLYELQAADLRMRHGAIWTEVQHYTWVLSLIVGVPFVTYANAETPSNSLLIFLIVSSAFAAVFAIIAMVIIKKDFSYFTLSDSRLLFYERELGLTEIDELLDERTKRAHGLKSFNVAEDARAQNRFSLRWLTSLKMRFLILSVFFLYFCGAATMALYFSREFHSLTTGGDIVSSPHSDLAH